MRRRERKKRGERGEESERQEQLISWSLLKHSVSSGECESIVTQEQQQQQQQQQQQVNRALWSRWEWEGETKWKRESERDSGWGRERRRERGREKVTEWQIVRNGKWSHTVIKEYWMTEWTNDWITIAVSSLLMRRKIKSKDAHTERQGGSRLSEQNQLNESERGKKKKRKKKRRESVEACFDGYKSQ